MKVCGALYSQHITDLSRRIAGDPQRTQTLPNMVATLCTAVPAAMVARSSSTFRSARQQPMQLARSGERGAPCSGGGGQASGAQRLPCLPPSRATPLRQCSAAPDQWPAPWRPRGKASGCAAAAAHHGRPPSLQAGSSGGKLGACAWRQ